MNSIELTPAILRALAEGIERLNDGDLGDISKAAEVQAVVEAKGYKLWGYDFISTERTQVNAHLLYNGFARDVLDAGEKSTVLALADGPGFLGTNARFLDACPDAVHRMAERIGDLREAKGLLRLAE